MLYEQVHKRSLCIENNKTCGFPVCAIIENKDKSSNSNNDKKSTVSKTESLIYKTDKKCSEMTTRIFNEKAYKKTIN